MQGILEISLLPDMREIEQNEVIFQLFLNF